MWMQAAGVVASTGDSAVFEVLRVALALAGVCVLSLVALRFLSSRGLGRVGSATGRVRVIERVALDPQRALILVRVDGRLLLLGTGPNEGPRLLSELPDIDTDPGAAPPDAASGAQGDARG